MNVACGVQASTRARTVQGACSPAASVAYHSPFPSAVLLHDEQAQFLRSGAL